MDGRLQLLDSTFIKDWNYVENFLPYLVELQWKFSEMWMFTKIITWIEILSDLKKDLWHDNGLLLITFRNMNRFTVDYRDFNFYVLFHTQYKWEHFAFKIRAYERMEIQKIFPFIFFVAYG